MSRYDPDTSGQLVCMSSLNPAFNPYPHPVCDHPLPSDGRVTENRPPPLENPRAGIGIHISPMPAASWLNACATFAPAGKRTALESRTRLRRPRPAVDGGKLGVIWRSGVSAERRHLKISGNICGGLPTRRYEEVESSAVPLKIRAPGFLVCADTSALSKRLGATVVNRRLNRIPQ